MMDASLDTDIVIHLYKSGKKELLYSSFDKFYMYNFLVENTLSASEKAIYLCQVFEGEINNGGFSQFYFNSSGDLTMETLNSLIEIGAIKTSELLKKAISISPDAIVPKDREKRQELFDKISDEVKDELLGELDNYFYEYEDNLSELSYDYVTTHKSNFS